MWGQGIFFVDWFVLFVFKMGDITTHWLSDEYILERRKKGRSRSSREGKSRKIKFHEKAKGDGIQNTREGTGF